MSIILRTQKAGLCLTGTTLFLFAALSALGAGEAHAQSVPQLQSRIQQLENQVQTLSRSVYKGQPMPQGVVASEAATPAYGALQDRVVSLEGRVRTMTGEVERLAFENQQMKERLERALADIDMRFSDLGAGGGSTASAPSATATGSSPNTASSSSAGGSSLTTAPVTASSASAGTPPEVLYDMAFADVREAKYAEAEAKFKQFLSSYSDHQLASNAHYWLAETYYARGDYQGAAKAFATGYQKFPKSSKAADSLLKLALSLGKLNKTADACLSIVQLEKEFAGSTSPVMRRAADEKQNLKCK